MFDTSFNGVYFRTGHLSIKILNVLGSKVWIQKRTKQCKSGQVGHFLAIVATVVVNKGVWLYF
jgi:hypothetical protein